jgi:hypothetical protein
MIEVAGLEGDDQDLIKLSILSTSLPPESNETVEIPYGNETRKFAGRAVFESIPLVVHDYVDKEVRAAINRWRRLVYDPETGLVGLPSEYKKSGEIILVSSNNSILRKCRIIGMWPQAVSPGDMDMSSSEGVQIEVTLEYDRAIWLL